MGAQTILAPGLADAPQSLRIEDNLLIVFTIFLAPDVSLGPSVGIKLSDLFSGDPRRVRCGTLLLSRSRLNSARSCQRLQLYCSDSSRCLGGGCRLLRWELARGLRLCEVTFEESKHSGRRSGCERLSQQIPSYTTRVNIW